MPSGRLFTKAAADRGLGPDTVSFTRTAHAARRSVRAGLATATQALAFASSEAFAEICRELLPERRLRAAPRVLKRKMSNYGAKRAEHLASDSRRPRNRGARRAGPLGNGSQLFPHANCINVAELFITP